MNSVRFGDFELVFSVQNLCGVEDDLREPIGKTFEALSAGLSMKAIKSLALRTMKRGGRAVPPEEALAAVNADTLGFLQAVGEAAKQQFQGKDADPNGEASANLST